MKRIRDDLKYGHKVYEITEDRILDYNEIVDEATMKIEWNSVG